MNIVKTRVCRWGNSLGLRIPRAAAEEVGVGAGSTVDITVEDGELRVRAVRRRRYVLTDLLDEVSDSNIHGEVTTGGAVGRESW